MAAAPTTGHGIVFNAFNPSSAMAPPITSPMPAASPAGGGGAPAVGGFTSPAPGPQYMWDPMADPTGPQPPGDPVGPDDPEPTGPPGQGHGGWPAGPGRQPGGSYPQPRRPEDRGTQYPDEGPPTGRPGQSGPDFNPGGPFNPPNRPSGSDNRYQYDPEAYVRGWGADDFFVNESPQWGEQNPYLPQGRPGGGGGHGGLDLGDFGIYSPTPPGPTPTPPPSGYTSPLPPTNRPTPDIGRYRNLYSPPGG